MDWAQISGERSRCNRGADCQGRPAPTRKRCFALGHANIGRFNDQSAWTVFRIGPMRFVLFRRHSFLSMRRSNISRNWCRTPTQRACRTPRQHRSDDRDGSFDVRTSRDRHCCGSSKSRHGASHGEPVSTAASDSDVSKTVNRVAVLGVWVTSRCGHRSGSHAGRRSVTRAKAAGGKAKLLHLPEEDSLATAHVDDWIATI